MENNNSNEEPDLSIAGVSENISEVVEESVQEEITQRRLLEGLNVGISISEGEDSSLLGYSDIHQRDAMVEFARHLLIYGASLTYGGDLRKSGYTELFTELSFQYRSKKDKDRYPFRNFFSFPIYLDLNKVHRSEFRKSRVEIIQVEPDEEVLMEKADLFRTSRPETKVVWAKSLTRMRQQMNHATDARIFLGGRNYGFLGAYPGVVEEAVVALETSKPVYLIGAFGGATKRIINTILSGSPTIIETDDFYQSDAYRSFIDLLDQDNSDYSVDFDKVNRDIGNLSEAKLAELNGLSEAENRRLFVTTHISEMIFLVMKGLSVISQRKKL